MKDLFFGVLVVLVVLAVMVVLVLIVHLAMWLSIRPYLCTDQISATGASAAGMELECKTRGGHVSIEHVNATAVSVCRCAR